MNLLTHVMIIIAGLTISLSGFARGGAGGIGLSDRAPKTKTQPVIVNWIGQIKSQGPHTKGHEHDLAFIRTANGKSYDIVDSNDLVKTHCTKEKDLLVSVVAEKTPRFLFWGGNLIVKSFEIIEELGTSPHRVKLPNSRVKEFRGGASDRI